MNLELKSAGKRKQIALGKVFFSWEWWCTLVIPALRRLRQEDWNLEANLGYTSRRTCLKKREREREKKKKDIFQYHCEVSKWAYTAANKAVSQEEELHKVC
jgi:hypothetical protein